jgi:hypothetical protein
MNFSPRDRWMLAIRAAISFILLSASLYVIMIGQYPDAITKWAIGIIGIIVGYWLR